MDIEDLFNETLALEEHKDDHPMVIPEFGPCSGDGAGEASSSAKQGAGACCTTKSLACSSLQPCDCEKPKKLELVPQKSTEIAKKSLCFKCKVKPPSFTNKQDKVCKECFLDILIHKFKSSLRQNLKIWKDDLNLICISGGSNSMALLNLLYISLFANQSTRKMFFRVHILYIDECGAVYGVDEETRQRNIQFIVETCQRYKFTFTIVPIESVYDIDIDRVPLLDMRVADAEAAQRIDEEKKKDELEHSVPVNLDEVATKVIEVEHL